MFIFVHIDWLIDWLIDWIHLISWRYDLAGVIYECIFLNLKRFYIMLRRVWRYQRGNQNPYIEEEQTKQWSKEKVQKDKQRSTKHAHKTTDRVTRTPLKTGVDSGAPEGWTVPVPLVSKRHLIWICGFHLQLIHIQSNLYIKATQGNLKVCSLWAVVLYIHVNINIH